MNGHSQYLLLYSRAAEDGAAAFRAGQDESACPHAERLPVGNPIRTAWRRGYARARAAATDQIQPLPRSLPAAG
jgi:hypothetical protein